jgi:hypothetical protein
MSLLSSKCLDQVDARRAPRQPRAGGEATRRLLEDGTSEAEVEALLARFGTSPERAR